MSRIGYHDRVEAGRVLGDALAQYARRPDVLVLALPRGGVPVAAEVARKLEVALDVLVVRKLGVPGQEELALGAVASGGAMALNQSIIDTLGLAPDTIERIRHDEEGELARREEDYRGNLPRPAVHDKTVIIIDDGLATGATMQAAVQALRSLDPAKLIVAVPVAPADTLQRLADDVDELVCPLTPEAFQGVGRWYTDFAQVSDDEVRGALATHAKRM